MQFIRVDKILRKTGQLGDIPPNRTLLSTTISIAWPSILESFLLSLVGLVDTVMVGTLGSYAIAAVGLTTQPKFIGLAVFLSLNVAVSAIVARRRGEGDQESANRVLVQSLLIAVGLTAVISVVCVIFADPIIAFAGSAPDTHADAVGYFRIIMGGLIFTTISIVINAAQRGAGNTKIAMRTNMVSNIVNIFFNYLFIGGNFGFPRLEVRGAAVATVIGAAASCVMSILSVSHHSQFLHLHGLFHTRFDKATIRSIVNIGSSTLAEQAFMRFGFFVYAIIVAKLGTSAFAAHQVGMNLITVTFSLGDGLSVAAIALVGRSLGEQRPDLARVYGAICQRIGFCFSLGLAAVLLFGGRGLFLIFTRDPEVLQYSRMITVILAIVALLQISNVVYTGCLRGGGDTLFTALISLVSMAIIRPTSGWLFCYPFGLGLTGAWLGLLTDQFVRYSLSAIRFHSGKWTKHKI